jgi:hypothetical protein
MRPFWVPSIYVAGGAQGSSVAAARLTTEPSGWLRRGFAGRAMIPGYASSQNACITREGIRMLRLFVVLAVLAAS